MPPLSTLSQSEIQLLNDPTKSVKRAQLASLCRKVSLKVKGTNADIIAALNAAVYNDIADRENIDPVAHQKESGEQDNPFNAKKINSEDKEDDQETSFETVIRYNVKSTPATRPSTAARGRKSSARRKTARKGSDVIYAAPQGGLYPDLGNTYPNLDNIEKGEVPTASTEEFGKIADGILEEMNARVAAKLGEKPASPRIAAQPIFKDIVVPLRESPATGNATMQSKHRFSDVHKKIFHKMESVETHYAAQRDASESPFITNPIRVPKRPHPTTQEPSVESIQTIASPKRTRQGEDIISKARFLEGRREESLSVQAQKIQAHLRQEMQSRLRQKLGHSTPNTGNSKDGEDSIELESRKLNRTINLVGGDKLGNRVPKAPISKGNVIPVKMGGGMMKEDDGESPCVSGDRSEDIAIQPPKLSVEEPSIMLVPGEEKEIPKDKKVPRKHPIVSSAGSRALVIPAAKPIKRATRSSSARSAPVPAAVSPSKASGHTRTQVPSSHKPNFTMGSVPTSQSNIRRSQKNVLTSRISPSKRRITRSASAMATIRSVPAESTRDIQVPVKFAGTPAKRKYAYADEASPNKRIKRGENSAYTPVRKAPMTMGMYTPFTAKANVGMVTPGAVSSRTPLSKGVGRSTGKRPPWR